jgi:peptidyl-tRNA hydrolase, PTH1 family
VNELEKLLIIGLGNPGASYKRTRHNVGFEIVHAFAEKKGMKFRHDSQLIGDVAQGSVHDKKVILLCPSTYMNVSGESVRRCVDYYKVPIDHLIVVSDDVALPIGTLRLRPKGSSGGHNGLKSIESHLNTEHYARLKIGVGAPGEQVLADHVLGRFTEEESRTIHEAAVKAVAALEMWVHSGIAMAMQMANKKDHLKKEEGEKNG